MTVVNKAYTVYTPHIGHFNVLSISILYVYIIHIIIIIYYIIVTNLKRKQKAYQCLSFKTKEYINPYI